ncbi:hypothetical protein MRX96_020717 [Rhipicephalus microplus]
MAVPAGLAGDVGSRFQRRVREIEDELSRFFLDSVNKFPVPAQNFVMSRLFELTAFCGDLRVEAATERDAAVALRGQLVKTRKEKATLQASGVGGRPRSCSRRSRVFERRRRGLHPWSRYTGDPTRAWTAGWQRFRRSGPNLWFRRGESGAPAPRRYHEHLAFLTPSAQTTPARDVLWLLKTNIHPASKGITDIVLRHTRYGSTVFSNKNDAIQNLLQANAVTRATISVRVPNKGNPHIRFSGADPDVDKDRFFIILKERNAGLEIDEEWCKVRVPFRKRSGNNAFIGEVDPDSLKAFMSRTRLSLGWTMLQVFEDLHVPTCMFCATYGRGRTSCPQKTKESRATCMKCGGNHQAVVSMVRTGGGAVCCSECRRAGRPAVGHPVGFPGCPLLMERVARLRARTNYSPHK